MDLPETISRNRKPEYQIDPIFLLRWSPRALSHESIKEDELLGLFEAARWAPSAFNEQPWRFIYTTRQSDAWQGFFNLLSDGNRAWCKHAYALVLVLSKKSFSHNAMPNKTHNFDAGSAWQNLALEAACKGFVAHGMTGFDYEKARADFSIPDEFSIEAMIAIGKPGKKEDLPKSLRVVEEPNGRKPVHEFVFNDSFRQ